MNPNRGDSDCSSSQLHNSRSARRWRPAGTAGTLPRIASGHHDATFLADEAAYAALDAAPKRGGMRTGSWQLGLGRFGRRMSMSIWLPSAVGRRGCRPGACSGRPFQNCRETVGRAAVRSRSHVRQLVRFLTGCPDCRVRIGVRRIRARLPA